MSDLSIAVLWPFARHGRPSPGGRCARHRGWSGGSRCRLVERRMRRRRIGWAPELGRGVGERLAVDGARGRLRRRPVIAARTAGAGIGVRLRRHGLRAAPPAREWADGLCHERRGHGAGPARHRSRPGPRRGRAGRHACPTTRSLQQLHGAAVRTRKMARAPRTATVAGARFSWRASVAARYATAKNQGMKPPAAPPT